MPTDRDELTSLEKGYLLGVLMRHRAEHGDKEFDEAMIQKLIDKLHLTEPSEVAF